MIKNYFKIAWRNIKRHKGFSLLNAGGLSLGMASCLLLLLYIGYHLNYDKQFADLDRIYIIQNNQPGDGVIHTFTSTPRPMAQAIKTQAPGVEAVARFCSYTAEGLITYNDKAFKKNGAFVDNSYFEIFNYRFVKGDAGKALIQPNSIVLTEDMAKILFGDADPIAKVIKRNDKTELIVTGIIENLKPNTSYKFDYLLPWAVFENEQDWVKNSGWGSNFARTFVKLKDAAGFAQADGVVRKLIAQNNEGDKAVAMLYPYGKLHLYSDFKNGKVVGGLIDQVKMFAVLALVILLIACFNFMNLSTARSEERAKEVGIRKAIGSGRQMLIWQFVVESVMLCLFSMVIALFLLSATIPWFNNLLNIKLSFPYADPLFWIGLITLALVTGLAAGSYPAFYLSSFNPIKVLKGTFKAGNSGLPVRKVLVVMQFVSAVFLITATICIYRQIKYVQNKSIGYDKADLVQIRAEGVLKDKAELLFAQLKAKGAITHGTTLLQSMTSSGNNTWNISWPGKREDERILFDVFHGGFDLTKTTGMKLIAGREFSKSYPADTAGFNLMVNEAAVKVMNLKDPVGAVIKMGGADATIIGVYKDFVWGSPYDKIRPMYTSCSGYTASEIVLRLNNQNSIQQNFEAIEKELKAINPSYPPVIQFVDADFDKKFQAEQLLGTLANLFGGLAIVISCLGLFGLAAYAAEQRTKEIGVRKVLGASVGNVVTLLSKDFIKLVAIAIVLAVPLAIYVLGKWLDGYEYRISLSWWILALAGAITALIALITVSFQAIRAALANPVKSLRSE
ncbi:ABC transporter permease [Mucilaginibacter myungsuensis]|uniref:ABC transporter permease n=1 Tax=Mucilaginibacter myungsuensis TaxID=649104 RepID=A0A929KSF0_9SPHI|nr:ABC transporter permease [Mucilaginibacter myungsuensis]MBE9660654.1 ABC transporter permease [Mucilaginibacter myungsuensis]MDN3600699.1 ABC transporter permease [Mucilaginibacter myungsuensis]